MVAGDLSGADLAGTVALIATPGALEPSLATPRDPDMRAMSEAIFRAHAVHDLRTGRQVVRAAAWNSWILLFAVGLALAITYRRSDPKQLILRVSIIASVLIAAVV